MKFILLFAGILFIKNSSCQGLTDINEAKTCSQAKANLELATRRVDGTMQVINKFESYVGQLEEAKSSAGISAIIAMNEKELDKKILEFTTKINSARTDPARKASGDLSWIGKEKVQADEDYYTAVRELYKEVRTRKLMYGAVESSEIKAAGLKNRLGSFLKKKIYFGTMIVVYQKDKADAGQKLAELKCNSNSKRTSADEAAREETAIEKLLGGWTDQPTPWGTPGGACQIVKEEGKLKLVNEDKDKSGASVSVDSEGNVTIQAKDWPVKGKVSKDFKSITWSNNSVWTR